MRRARLGISAVYRALYRSLSDQWVNSGSNLDTRI
jgi:hypothetical protein